MDSALSFRDKLILSGSGVVICSFGYCVPWIWTRAEKVVYLLEWFSWILRYGFIVLSVVGVIVFVIICVVEYYFKPQGKEQDEDKVDEHVSTLSTTVRPSQPEYNNNNNYRVTEVDDDRYYNNRNNNNSSYYMENTVPAYEQVRRVEERYERTVTEEKRVTMTRSEEKEKKKKKKKKDKVTMEYKRTESERMTKMESCMSRKNKDDKLSSEAFRMKVESFIIENRKKFHWKTGEADHYLNGTSAGCQSQQRGTPNDAIDQYQYGGQNGGTPHQAIDQWRYGGPQWAIDQWGSYEPQRQNGGSGYGQDGWHLAISD